MKVGVCVIVKNENKYLQEFVNYYKSIGVDTIFIFDNNDVDGEKIDLDNYDDIIVIDVRGAKAIQMEVYTVCYKIYRDKYDWICFFDCDEFLHFNDEMYQDNIKYYLSDPIFNNYDEIKINWISYGDSNIEELTDNYSITRFTKPVYPLDFMSNFDFPQNNHCKSILRCKQNFYAYFFNPHYAENVPANRICNNAGKPSTNDLYEPINYEKAELRHYYTKTINEFILKIDRGWPDLDRKFNITKLKFDLYMFFKYNQTTPYKIKQIHNYLQGKYNKVLKIYVCAHKQFNTDLIPKTCHEIIYNYECNNDMNDFKLSLSEGYSIYEILKNKDISKYEHIGICHYRRYFNMDIDDIIDNLYKYDILVTKSENLNNTVYNQYASCFNKDDLNVLETIINDNTPEYNKSFKAVMMNNYMYCYNMCIMKRNHFIDYYNWAFLILKKFCEYHNFKNDNDIINYIKNNQANIGNMNNNYIPEYFRTVEYCSRILGHLMERLMNIYIYKHFKNIYEVPMKFIEDAYSFKEPYILNINKFYN